MTKELLEKNYFLKPPRVGEIIEGTVIGRKSSAIFLDLSPFGTGIIYGKEFFEAKDKLKKLNTGEKIYAKIIELENEEGYIELSLSGASLDMTWKVLQEKKEKKEKIKVKITSANKGGLLTKVFEIPAFLPLSQLSAEHYPRVEDGDTTKILKTLQQFVGKELDVKIFDLDPKTQKIILSEKADDLERTREVLKNYKVGDVIEGTISGITDFGAFLKFDQGVEGLIHISELDWKIIKNPAEVVKVGQKVQAKIVSIDGEKVSFSLKALKENPWLNFEKKYKKGEVILGEITKLNSFGALVKINDYIQGLCHISQFINQEDLERKLKIGQQYKFEILEINPYEHRLNLKLRES